jgi:tetratricopeptide (TPR) repeat protein
MPNSAPLQNLLGYSLATNGHRDEARKALTAALAIDPSLVACRVRLALLDIEEGKYDSARRGLEAAARTPGMQAQAESALGMLEAKAGNPSAGIPHYRKALDADPNNVTALNNLAYLLADGTDRIDEALQYAQKAKELDPDASAVEDTIGWAFYRKGLFDSAVTHLRNASVKEPIAVFKYHLAMAYLKAGDRPHGRQALDEARRMNPSLPEAGAAAQLMASLGGAN